MTQAYNLSQLANKVNTSGQLDPTTGLSGQVPVANGGTGSTNNYTNGQLLIGNSTGGTLTKSTLTAGTGISITNGAGSITITGTSGSIQTQIFTAPGTWTCPTTVTQVRVTVIGGGGGGGGTSSPGGGNGGYAKAIVPVSAPVNITVGGGGQPFPVISAGTSSFGPAVSCTGGGVGSGPIPSPTTVQGTATVAVGTALRTSNALNVQDSFTSGIINPSNNPVNTANTYSISGDLGAGYGGAVGPGSGTPGRGGTSGAVVVEWIG